MLLPKWNLARRWIGDRLPQSLRRRLDVDLENLFHRILQSLLELDQRRCPWLGVLADPSVVGAPDGDGVQEVQLLASTPPGDDETGVLEQLSSASSRRCDSSRTAPPGAQRLTVLAKQLVEQRPSGRVGERLEHISTSIRYVTVSSYMSTLLDVPTIRLFMEVAGRLARWVTACHPRSSALDHLSIRSDECHAWSFETFFGPKRSYRNVSVIVDMRSTRSTLTVPDHRASILTCAERGQHSHEGDSS